VHAYFVREQQRIIEVATQESAPWRCFVQLRIANRFVVLHPTTSTPSVYRRQQRATMRVTRRDDGPHAFAGLSTGRQPDPRRALGVSRSTLATRLELRRIPRLKDR